MLLLIQSQNAEYFFPVFVAKKRRSSSFGMRHHSKHIALFVTNAGNVSDRAVRVKAHINIAMLITVMKYYLIICFKVVEQFFISIISSFAMRNRNFQRSATIVFYKN